jgi:hypothetical protein
MGPSKKKLIDNSKYYFIPCNFSIVDFKRFSLQVEPYLKTPLKSVVARWSKFVKKR